MSSIIELITDEWPVVISRWPADGDDAEINAYFDKYPAVIERARTEGQILWLNDIRKISITATTARRRRLVADRLAEHSANMRELVRREAVIVNSIWARASLTAVHMLSPPGWELKIFQNEAGARQWLEEARGGSGIQKP